MKNLVINILFILLYYLFEIELLLTSVFLEDIPSILITDENLLLIVVFINTITFAKSLRK
ncbi:MAG: hypothetical protein N2560_06480 [Ignavibacteria bacterium]|nr:hypothetical protein [Ignavibacteria bacterium]